MILQAKHATRKNSVRESTRLPHREPFRAFSPFAFQPHNCCRTYKYKSLSLHHMANSSTKVCLQSLITLMYSLSYDAYSQLAFVTNGVLMLSGREHKDIKFILGRAVSTTHLTRQGHLSNPPPTLICDSACSCAEITIICETGRVDPSRATALYPWQIQTCSPVWRELLVPDNIQLTDGS